MKKYKKTIIKISVSIALFVLIFSRLDIEQLLESFGQMNWVYLPIIFSFLILNYIFSSIRWKRLLIYPNSEKAGVWYLTSLYFIGSFFNNFMPTSIGGDVYKVYKLGKKLDSTANAFSATFMERFTGVIALMIISAFAMVYVLKLWGFLLFVGFWIGLAFGFYALSFLSKKSEKIRKIYSSLIEYKGKNDVLIFALVTSFIVQLLAIFTQYLIFLALGYELPLFYSLFMFPIIILASFIIPSLNGIGVQDALYIMFFGEMTYIGLFGGAGTGAAVAVTASIVYHLSRLLVSLIGGVLYATGRVD
jgi:uncharacterized membrane protein YbhN (UPF0104 family)